MLCTSVLNIINNEWEDEFDVDEMERVRSVNHPEEIYDCFVQAKRLETIRFAFDD